jgi:hypothetical protein
MSISVKIFLTNTPLKRIHSEESLDALFVSGFSAGFCACRSMTFPHLLTHQGVKVD